MPLLLVNRFLSFLYESIEADEPFGSDDDELSVDEDFDSDVDEEFSEPDELDFEMRDLELAEDDELNVVLFELEMRTRGQKICRKWNTQKTRQIIKKSRFLIYLDS